MNPPGRAQAPDKQSSPHSVVRELSGYAEMGMCKEALALARRVLKRSRLEPEVFNEAIHTFLVHQTKLKSVLPLVTDAYFRLKKKDQRKVRHSMLDFYFSLGDHGKALLFTTFRPKNGMDYLLSFRVFLALDLKKEAKRMAHLGRRMLSQHGRPKEIAILPALAKYCEFIGELDIALSMWRLIPTQESTIYDKQGSMVRNRVAETLKILNESLEEIEDLAQNSDRELDVSHPGLDKKLIEDSRKELLTFRKVLERILPQKQWKAFGLVDEEEIHEQKI